MDLSREISKRFVIASRIVTIHFLSNTVLMVIKLLTGYYGNSDAVIGDGIESTYDFVSIIATFVALKIGRKSYDVDHPCGQVKAEVVSAVFVSIIIIAAGGGILYNSIIAFIRKTYPAPKLIVVAAAFITILVKETIFHFTHRVASKLDSPLFTPLPGITEKARSLPWAL
jgi:cation diffusion facilitator family transporter